MTGTTHAYGTKGIRSRIKSPTDVILYCMLKVLRQKKEFLNKREFINEIINEIRKNKSLFFVYERSVEKQNKRIEKIIDNLHQLSEGKRKDYRTFDKIYVILRETGIFTEYRGRIYSNIYNLQPTIPELKFSDKIIEKLWEHSAKLLGLIKKQPFIEEENDSILGIPKDNVEYFIQHLETSDRADYRELLTLYREVGELDKKKSKKEREIRDRYKQAINNILVNISDRYKSKINIDVNLIGDVIYNFVIKGKYSILDITKNLLKISESFDTKRNKIYEIQLGAYILMESKDYNIIKEVMDDIISILTKAYEIKKELKDDIDAYYSLKEQYKIKLGKIKELMKKIKREVYLGKTLDGFCPICQSFQVARHVHEQSKNE